MPTRKLRAVPDDEDLPMSAGGAVSDAASGGDMRNLLVALRDRIAREMDGDVQARDLASLSLRLMAIAKELEELDARTEGDAVGNAAETPDENWEPV